MKIQEHRGGIEARVALKLSVLLHRHGTLSFEFRDIYSFESSSLVRHIVSLQVSYIFFKQKVVDMIPVDSAVQMFCGRGDRRPEPCLGGTVSEGVGNRDELHDRVRS